MKIPTSVSIPAPHPVSTVCKKAIILSSSGSALQTIPSGSLLKLTKVSTESKYKQYIFILYIHNIIIGSEETSSSSKTKTSGSGQN